MDKESWDPRVCHAFFTGNCPNGSKCRLKHTQPIREVVCKGFLIRRDCKKGALCPFLHEIIQEKLPECRNFSADGSCSNKDCKFRHSCKKEVKECVYFNMGTFYLGFCEQGRFCKFKHVKKTLCFEFIETGKCPLGESCKKYHLESIADAYLSEAFYKLHPDYENFEFKNLFVLCNKCMNFGHSALMCLGVGEEVQGIRCYSCGGLGHKSMNCPGFV